MQSEEIADYAGLIRSAPMVAVAMTAIMFSLLGLPPLAGFWGKLGAFQALVEAGGPLMIFVLVVGGLNTAVSLVYYVRVAKTMCMDSPPDTSRPVQLGMLSSSYVAAVALPVLVLGLFPNTVWQLAEYATAGLFG